MNNNNIIHIFRDRLKVVETNTTVLFKEKEQNKARIERLEKEVSRIQDLMNELKFGARMSDMEVDVVNSIKDNLFSKL